MVGLAILIIGIIISVVIGRKISQPIRALSHASRKISDLDFRNVKTLPSSRLKELDEASEAYNTMLRGLSWFENYVPKSLVRKLMETGDAHSESRSVTVMFTDIVSFTPLAERMSSEEVADMLNHHFELVTRCIEDEGGTVDKFIGDAVMAFWGAPENQTDHAARACRAAKAIREAIMADNKIRREKDLDPIRMRIGIHSGTLVVGNIGSSGRINYTVVGDTVNISQRIEQLGKTLCNDDGQEVTILLSETTMNQSNDCLALESVGSHPMKGRNQSIVLYKAS
nr:adenylate/guanylate cyclase domain-containing protein [Sneathiella aquimaris]